VYWFTSGPKTFSYSVSYPLLLLNGAEQEQGRLGLDRSLPRLAGGRNRGPCPQHETSAPPRQPTTGPGVAHSRLATMPTTGAAATRRRRRTRAQPIVERHWTTTTYPRLGCSHAQAGRSGLATCAHGGSDPSRATVTPGDATTASTHRGHTGE
jgi:hypothetical protein